MKSKKTVYIICTIFSLIAIYSGYQMLSIMNEYKIGNDTYNNLKEYVNNESVEENATQEIQDTSITVDFTSLKNINSDTVAWIYIEDTNINYPIVRGKDNDYYLNHLIDGTSNTSGSIFMDYRNEENLNNRHTIIYGHNMANGTMFADLNKYKDQSFWSEHPSYTLITPDKNYKVKIISGYVANVKEDTWKIDFSNEKEFQNWINWTKEKSLFESDITPSIEDKIITLSTCSYEFDNARFVLVGILKSN